MKDLQHKTRVLIIFAIIFFVIGLASYSFTSSMTTQPNNSFLYTAGILTGSFSIPLLLLLAAFANEKKRKTLYAISWTLIAILLIFAIFTQL